MIVDTSTVLRAIERLLQVHAEASCGAVQSGDVHMAAFWLAQAESMGLTGFGVEMLLRDLDRLSSMEQDQPSPHTGNEPSGSLSVDARRLPGPLALAMAVRRAAEQVASHGSAIIGIRHVGALGVLGCAARTLAQRGCVALLAANSGAFVAPHGGCLPVLGTNPLAIAAPRADKAPWVIDYATSPLTLAALKRARAAGDQIAPSVALDSFGQSTTDPAQVAALLPAGKVASLTGLAIELLTGIGVGGRAPAGHAASARSGIFMAFSPDAMGNFDAGALCAQLSGDWAQAGGHVPARFDALALTPDALAPSLLIADATWSALSMRAGQLG